jgi:hypothetical protein
MFFLLEDTFEIFGVSAELEFQASTVLVISCTFEEEVSDCFDWLIWNLCTCGALVSICFFDTMEILV